MPHNIFHENCITYRRRRRWSCGEDRTDISRYRCLPRESESRYSGEKHMNYFEYRHCVISKGHSYIWKTIHTFNMFLHNKGICNVWLQKSVFLNENEGILFYFTAASIYLYEGRMCFYSSLFHLFYNEIQFNIDIN